MAVERTPWAYWASNGTSKAHFLVPVTSSFYQGTKSHPLCGTYAADRDDWAASDAEHCKVCERIVAKELENK